MRNSKVLPMVAILLFVLALCCLSVFFGFTEAQNALVENAFISRKVEVDMIEIMMRYSTGPGSTWEVDKYDELLITMIEDMDLNKFYIQMFDENLKSRTERFSIFGDEIFNPLLYDEFLQEIANNEYGELTVHVTSINAVDNHDIHLYFRWIPLSTTKPDRRLIVVGNSIHTIERNIGMRMLISVFVFLPMMLGMIVWIGVQRHTIERMARLCETTTREYKGW